MLSLMIEIGSTPSVVAPVFGFSLLVAVVVMVAVGYWVFRPRSEGQERVFDEAAVESYDQERRLRQVAMGKMDTLMSGSSSPHSLQSNLPAGLYHFAREYGFGYFTEPGILKLIDIDSMNHDTDWRTYVVPLDIVRDSDPVKLLGCARATINKRAKTRGLKPIKRKPGRKSVRVG